MSNPWPVILQNLEQTISRPNFITWLKSSKLIEDRGGVITIAVANPYAKNWIEKNSLERIKELLSDHYDQITEIRIVVQDIKPSSLEGLPLLQDIASESLAEAAPAPSPSPQEPKSVASRPFNDKYSFENFIVGNNNRLAFAAAQVVSDKPGTAYNPLFLYGGVGLGKTHLMQAIGNAILAAEPKKKIIYTSCEIFTSEFVEALQTKRMNEFKQKYRSIDVFLIDDIQFLANKEGTQEEFFHTFNMLHQSNRQIVITSDRVPKEIPQLEERLSSRFGWGLVADIQSPNFETRVAILQAKAAEKEIEIPSDVLELVANTITANVRELEGSLLRLIAAAQLEQIPINRDFALRVLKDLISPAAGGTISSRAVLHTIAKHFDIEVADILGKKRIKELVYPRQIAMYILREQLHQSFPQIGETLGGKDHTTVMHGVQKISELQKQNPEIEKDLRAIINSLRQGK